MASEGEWNSTVHEVEDSDLGLNLGVDVEVVSFAGVHDEVAGGCCIRWACSSGLSLCCCTFTPLAFGESGEHVPKLVNAGLVDKGLGDERRFQWCRDVMPGR